MPSVLSRRAALGLAVALPTLAVAACGRGVRTSTPAAGAWEALPDWPLRPRGLPERAWTGREAVFVGGELSPPCPPAASCVGPVEYARDGAALDPVARTWRVVAPAPQPVPGFSSAVVLGDSVYLFGETDLLRYVPDQDAWSVVQLPVDPRATALVSDGERLVVVRGERRTSGQADLVYEPTRGTWSELPTDPLVPAFDRGLTATAAGLVLTGLDLVAQPGSEKPAVVRAAVLAPGASDWALLPDSDQIGAGPWAWTGRRMVSPRLGGADGGEVNGYGRVIPFGGVLDPATGTWSRLPSPPSEGQGGWPVWALGGPVSAAEGWLYDDRDTSWTRLRRPRDAPESPGAALWAGDDLVVVGGLEGPLSPTGGTRSTGAWIFGGS